MHLDLMLRGGCDLRGVGGPLIVKAYAPKTSHTKNSERFGMEQLGGIDITIFLAVSSSSLGLFK